MNNNKSVGIKHHSKTAKVLTDIVYYLAASLLYAVSVDVFSAPNEIVPGGVTGISTVLNAFFGLPIGTMMLLLNAPIFICGVIFVGWKYVARTGIGLLAVSVAIDLLEPILPKYTENMLLASIFGGVLMGVALALIFMRGGSTGGTDVVARIFGKYFPAVTQGKLIMMIDMVIIAGSSFAFGKAAGSFESGLNAALYAVIALFVCSTALDKVLYGNKTGCQVFIITNNPEEVNRAIIEQMDRGTTLLQGRGGYSGNERQIIMCAVRNNELYRVRSIVRDIDHNAFMIVGTASDILGEGFQSMRKNEFGETEEEPKAAIGQDRNEGKK